jgi:hypothetical protein
MEIAELKKYSRPRRSPLVVPLKFKPWLELRGKDFKYCGVRYKIIGRSRTRPVTHWKTISLSERLENGKSPTEIEFEESLIVEILAEDNANQIKLKSFTSMVNGDYGTSFSTR